MKVRYVAETSAGYHFPNSSKTESRCLESPSYLTWRRSGLIPVEMVVCPFNELEALGRMHCAMYKPANKTRHFVNSSILLHLQSAEFSASTVFDSWCCSWIKVILRKITSNFSTSIPSIQFRISKPPRFGLCQLVFSRSGSLGGTSRDLH